ncbi:tyrosine-type recombinase/integrase [Acinetobacter baumannii]|nr:integrase [Acinetobacter baumannii]
MKRSDIKRRPLSDSVLANLEVDVKEYREKDSDNLYFRVKVNGNKSWQLRYKNESGIWTWFGLGAYPEVSGKLARQKASEIRKLISNGCDLKQFKQNQMQAKSGGGRFDFKSLAQEYCDSKTWVEDTRTRNVGALHNHIYPIMGNRDFRKITKKEWLELFQVIQRKLHPRTGKPIIEMGNRVRGLCKDIYDFAEVKGLIDHNPIHGVQKFLEKHTKQNMLHITEEELPDLLKAIRNYPSQSISIGLQLSIMLGCRPTEMRMAEWKEFNLERALWVIPAHRMKKRIEHTIPLPQQALELLGNLKYYSGDSPYLFRGRDSTNKAISNNTFNKALKTMGYAGKQTPHGFRHILSTALRERGFAREHVEAALAHKTGGVEGVYNKAVYLSQRTEMMQLWADYLDAVVKGENFNLMPPIVENTNIAQELGLNQEQSDEIRALFSKLLKEVDDVM